MKTLIASIVIASCATAAQACPQNICVQQQRFRERYVQRQVAPPAYYVERVIEKQPVVVERIKEVPVYIEKQTVIERQEAPAYVQRELLIEKQKVRRERLKLRAPLRQKSVRRERVVERQVY
jgi:hypothetical protein